MCPASPSASAAPGAPASPPRAPSALRRGVGGYGLVVVLLNLVAWTLLLVRVAPGDPPMLGLGVLAFTFGLRHGFDADHISAIDNTVRKLMQTERRRRPLGVGFYFSLGHSTVVALLALALVVAEQSVQAHIPTLQHVGSVVGTLVSGAFLYIIGFLNLAVLASLFALFRQMRGGRVCEAEVDEQLLKRGLMTRLLGSRWDMVRRDWHMYPVGFLFGLGFDTASEVALLAIAATAASQHEPLLTVMVLPLLFAAGMSLMDTADGVFMAAAYSWAFSDPLRKVYYNLTVTTVSVFVALAVGTVEVMQVLAGELRLPGAFWSGLQHLNFGLLGYGIVGVFVATWAIAYLVWKLRVQRGWTEAAAEP
jgi:high-affinity nickel-transport protein